ncbi:MAG TPA: NADH-quinone oxidoreductase subunit J [Actinomycetes bacterium]|nr:NADH-quinone oxidoreductase subunit J [Actinomycetes bacterium]
MSVELLAAAPTSTGEAVAFWVLAPVAVLAAILMIASRKAVHSALWMALTMVILAVMFIMQGGVFLGVVQVVVYTGAVMMLFLFVLMLVGVDASDSFVETLRGQRVFGLLLALGFALLIGAGISRAVFADAPGIGAANDEAGGHVEAVAEAIFTRYVFTFEVVSIVLITAAVGAMALTHKERLTARKSQPELSVERIKGAHPTPLPSPGVYAQHNAVDTPALLPDGRASEASVPEELRRRGNVRYTELEAAKKAQEEDGESE